MEDRETDRQNGKSKGTVVNINTERTTEHLKTKINRPTEQQTDGKYKQKNRQTDGMT